MSAQSDWKGLLAVVVILSGIAAAIWYVSTAGSAGEGASPAADGSPTTDQHDGIAAVFTCEGGKNITALFVDGNVRLSLSDGRELTVPRAISASGARYANPDESFVFWNKGDTAFIEEFGKQTYSSCTVQGS